MKEGRWIGASEAAAILGVSHDTVVRLARDGKFPAWQPGGSELRMRRDDVVKYLETTRVRVTK